MLPFDPAVVARIEGINWFSECGRPAPLPLFRGILWVDNWREARRWYDGWPWRNTTIEASNCLRRFLHGRYDNEYSEWNRICDEANKILDRVVFPVTSEFARRHGLERIVVECVGTDMRMSLVESAYAKFRPPRFFTTVLLPLYEHGHFPCGWEGAWPQGRLIAI